MVAKVKFIDSVLDIAHLYDAFIIDQWGVLHNGSYPYEQALQTVIKLKELDKKILVLTNSAKRADYNYQKLASLGFSTELIDFVISSGEAFYEHFLIHKSKQFSSKCFFIGSDNAHYSWAELGIDFSNDIQEVGWILLSSIDGGFSMQKIADKLLILASRKIPLVCLNPDIVAVSANGYNHPAPGAVAKKYEQLGGPCVYFGKPYLPVYQSAIEKLGHSRRILCIGDSLEHDIKGANQAELDSLFIGYGIFNDQLQNILMPKALQVVADLSLQYNVSPQWYCYSFC